MQSPRFNDEYGCTYVLIEPGQFIMGDSVGDGLPRESPPHTVEISQPFFIGQRPVTQMHWDSIMGNNPSKFQDGWSSGLRPVENISWHNCMTFLAKLNKKYDEVEFLSLRGIWRLPTESEWEYCARSGTTTKWSCGDLDSEIDEYVWHAGNAGASTREVGLKKSNKWDLHDMNGLVAEWCQDNFRNDYSEHSMQSPFVNESDIYCHRGGNWFTESDSTRCSARGFSPAFKTNDGIGMRLVWEPK